MFFFHVGRSGGGRRFGNPIMQIIFPVCIIGRCLREERERILPHVLLSFADGIASQYSDLVEHNVETYRNKTRSHFPQFNLVFIAAIEMHSLLASALPACPSSCLKFSRSFFFFVVVVVWLVGFVFSFWVYQESH